MPELQTENPLVDISPENIDKLFNCPPEDLTPLKIDEIIAMHRQLRGRREMVEKEPKAPKEVKEKIPKEAKAPREPKVSAGPKKSLAERMRELETAPVEIQEDPGF
jgi:hypothetical protein